MVVKPDGKSPTVSSSSIGPVHTSCPAGSRMVRSTLGPEGVLVEHEPLDLERIVDPDVLARDLPAVLEHGQVGHEVGGLAVGEHAAPAKLLTLTSRLSGVPTGWTGAVWPSPTNTTVSKPRTTVTAPPTRNRIEPEVGEQRRQLEVLVPVALEPLDRAIGGGGPADLEAPAAEHRRHVVGAPARRAPAAPAPAGAGRRTAAAGRRCPAGPSATAAGSGRGCSR